MNNVVSSTKDSTSKRTNPSKNTIGNGASSSKASSNNMTKSINKSRILHLFLSRLWLSFLISKNAGQTMKASMNNVVSSTKDSTSKRTNPSKNTIGNGANSSKS